MNEHQSSDRGLGTDGASGTLGGALAQVGITRRGWSIAGMLLWRALLLGAALYLILTPEQNVNLRLNFLSYIFAFVWSYYDGLFTRGWWRYAWIEAIFLHLAAVQVGNLLALIFGNPVLSS